MRLRSLLCYGLVFLLGATSASAQVWKIVTPRQVLPVPSDGSTVNFPNVNLVTGMKYRVHASGVVTVSNTGDKADASYYIKFGFGISPTIVPVSLKTRTNASNEDWFFNFWSASGFQINFQPSHIYDASITSLGSPLSFRFFDNVNPPSNYYSDNSGSLLIDVARETPGIVIWKDTLDFGTVRVGIPKTLPDSIETYGVDGLNITRFSIIPAGKFTFSSGSPPHVFTDTTNEFLFTYSPTGSGCDSAEFHIFSSNGFGADTEKIIYLRGCGISTNLSFTTDTLDFGAIKTGTSKTLPDSIINSGNSSVNVISITPETPGSSFTPIGAPLTAFANSRAPFTVKFSPLVNGNYFEKFDVLTDDGSVFHFFAKGIAGVPIVVLGQNVLDFGKVILTQPPTQSRTLSVKYGNSGIGPLNIVATNNSNNEYSIAPAVKPSYPGGVIDSLTFTFFPKTHIPGCGNHPGTFTINYDDGTSTTITFKGCDHLPVPVKLVIDTLYYVPAGQTVDVTERLLEPGDPLDSTLDPVTTLNEELNFDATLFDFVSISKASLINSSAWTLTTKTIPLPGVIAYTISSATSRFTSSGSLVIFRFRAHADDKKGEFTNLVQNFVSFDKPLDLNDTETTGRITISDICSPVQLIYGNQTTSIEQNNPNPFNAETHIQFAIGRDAKNGVSGEAVHVKITLFDQAGRVTQVLIDEDKSPGAYDILFNGSHYPSGTYTYILQAGEHVEVKTMMLVK